MKQSDLKALMKNLLQQTCQELTLTIESRLNKEQAQPSEAETYHGISGLAKALGVSKVTAQRWKTLGYLEGGYQQIGNSIIIADPQKLRDTAERRMANAKQARKGNRVSYSIL